MTLWLGYSVDIDYTLSSTTFTFAAGETESFIVVTVADDSVAELEETIQVDLTNPSGNLVIGAASTATVTIMDSELTDVSEIFSTCIYFTSSNFRV